MKVLIVINEKAGGLSPETVEKSLREELRHYPASLREGVEIWVTGDLEALRTKIASNAGTLERVAAAGGDGTVVEVISAILPFPHIDLGIIPVGTGNRLAANLGIPANIKGALETVLKGQPHAIDVGRINDRYFALMAGAGLDAEIMDDIHPLEKRTMGVLAYFWKGIQSAFRTPYAVFDIVADGQRIRCRGIGVVVANAGNLLGRYFTLTPGAEPDDGYFDICVLASRNRADYWTTMIQVLSQQKRGIHEEGIRHLRSRRIQIKSRPRMKVQADGDVIGTTPIDIEALPDAVKVLIPAPNNAVNPLADSLHHIGDHVRLVLRDIFKI